VLNYSSALACRKPCRRANAAARTGRRGILAAGEPIAGALPAGRHAGLHADTGGGCVERLSFEVILIRGACRSSDFHFPDLGQNDPTQRRPIPARVGAHESSVRLMG